MNETTLTPDGGEASASSAGPEMRKIPKWVFAVDILLVIAAAAMIFFSGFWKNTPTAAIAANPAPLAGGSATLESLEGEIVSFNVEAGYGFYAERFRRASDNITGRYLLSEANGEPITILVSKSGFEDADQMNQEMIFKLVGQRLATATQLTGQGYVRRLTDDELQQAYSWLERNRTLLENSGFIDVSDAANFIGTHVVVMDYIGSISAATSGMLVRLAIILLAMTLVLPVSVLLKVRTPADPEADSGEEDEIAERSEDQGELNV